MTPPSTINVIVLVLIVVAVLVADALMSRPKQPDPDADELRAWLRRSRCGRCQRPTTPWPGEVATLCIDCAIAELEEVGYGKR